VVILQVFYLDDNALQYFDQLHRVLKKHVRDIDMSRHYMFIAIILNKRIT
jgi:hypothetical protein